MRDVEIVREPIDMAQVRALADEGFSDLVKAVVDIDRHIMAIGGELHAHEEATLLDDGSRLECIWGVSGCARRRHAQRKAPESEGSAGV